MADNLDKLISGATTEVRTSAKPIEHKERCQACVNGNWAGKPGYPCFKCKGTGFRTFKTSASERRAHVDRTHARKAKLAADRWHDFVEWEPAVAAWIELKRSTFEFAQKMRDAVEQHHRLTDGQLAACKKCIDRDAAAQATKAERIAAAPVADTAGIDRLKLAFDTAVANASAKGLKMRTPKITIGGMKISPAKATSTNPGALYVNGSANSYLGKIKDGRFFAAGACSADQEKQILAFVADPAAAAKAYGQTTGVCCICNATLISKWKLRGIGPICAQRFGW